MFGNIPLFVGWIGTGVVLAILLASINTMLMSMREQSRDIGIQKSLGFTDGSMFALLATQALLLCLVGGGIGVGIAWVTRPAIADWMAKMFPGFVITGGTYAIAAAVTVGLGLAAGALPAHRARRLRPIEALRGTE
jgi:putative ABC transport system permease protein